MATDQGTPQWARAVDQLRADLPVRAMPRVRQISRLRWAWWTTLGRHGMVLDLPQYALTRRAAERRAKRAADDRNAHAHTEVSGLRDRRDDGLVP
jgi:hypothetical protein